MIVLKITTVTEIRQKKKVSTDIDHRKEVSQLARSLYFELRIGIKYLL